MQDDTVISEFTHQAESFNASPSSRAGETLDGLVRVAAPEPHERWLEVACGPGIISRPMSARCTAWI
ncbi:MAG: hypothetical protein ACXVUE_19930 [Solirubrobacteraceae bacterium]